MAVTILDQLINPQVMGDMISAELKKGLGLNQFIKVDTTLTARPGDTITIPTWQYIGMANDLGENEEGEIDSLEATYVDYKVKKAVKNVTLTDEAVLSAYGDPVGETNRQLALSLRDKIVQDGIEQLQLIEDGIGLVSTAADVNYEAVVNAIDLLDLEEQGTELYLLANKEIVRQLRLDPQWIGRDSMLADEILSTGVVGSIAGARVVISNRLEDTEAYVLTPESLTAFMKRDVTLEVARGEEGVLYKRTLFSGDAHYVVAIERYDKLVKIEVE